MSTSCGPRQGVRQHDGALTWSVARWEFRLLTRSASFWLAALAAASAALNLARTEAENPPLVAYGLAQWALTVVPLLLLPALGSVRRRDEAAEVHELVHSRPVGGLEYVLGKFAAGWAAMAAAWLLSLAVAAATAAVVLPGSLSHWADVVILGGVLVVPVYGFVTALCLAVDAAWGRVGAVLAVGTAVTLSALFYVADLWASLLLPLFLPRDISPVFGSDPYTGGLLANRTWTLALGAALLALAIWLLPRRGPAIRVPAARPVVAGLLIASVVAGALAVRALVPVPRPLDWRGQAREWEMAQVRDAAPGGPAGERYWHRHRLEADTWPVEAWVARGSEDAAAPLARHAAALLPHVPGLQPAGGEPFRVLQGSYLHSPRLEDGALVVFGKDVNLAATADGRRALLRAMADAYWGSLAQLPVYLPDEPFYVSLLDTWAAGPSIFHQWLVLEQTAGPAAMAEEQALWRQNVEQPGPAGDEAWVELMRRGVLGYGGSDNRARQAMVLWDLAEELGRERVLNALIAAAGGMPPFAARVWCDDTRQGISGWTMRLTPDEGPYWAVVSAALGTDVTTLPGWPEAGPGSPGW